MDKVHEEIDKYVLQTKTNGWFDEKRGEQDVRWYRSTIQEEILNYFLTDSDSEMKIKQDEAEIRAKRKSPFEASEEILEKWIKKR